MSRLSRIAVVNVPHHVTQRGNARQFILDNDAERLHHLGPKFFRGRAFHLTVGKEYIVFGLTIVIDADASGRGVLVQLINDYGHLVSTPASLFEIVDGTASRYWQARILDDGTLKLWPPSFYGEYYHDDLSEGLPEIVNDFRQVRALIESEAVGRTSVTK